MPIQVGGTPTTSLLTSSTSPAINLPSGIVAGELLVIVYSVAAGRTVTQPSGWTKTASGQNGSGGTDRICEVWTKTADGTEGATATATLSTGSSSSAVAIRVQNWTGTIAVSTLASGTSTAPDAPSLTSGFGSVSTMWISALSARTTTLSGTPAGYTSTSALSSNLQSDLSYKVSTAATENPGAYAMSPSDVWAAFTIAISDSGGAANSSKMLMFF